MRHARSLPAVGRRVSGGDHPYPPAISWLRHVARRGTPLAYTRSMARPTVTGVPPVQATDSRGGDSRRELGARRWLGTMPRNVVVAGVVSLFTDVSSEMIVPVLPLFLTL